MNDKGKCYISWPSKGILHLLGLCNHNLVWQGYPTQFNHGPHTCQPSRKAGHMEQKLGEFYRFSEEFSLLNFIIINNKSGLIEQKVII